MKKIKLYSAIFAVSLIAACDTKPQNAGIKKPVQTSATQASYGLQATRDDWPELSGRSQIDENLLATNYYIIFDGSGSMKDRECSGSTNKLNIAKDAVVKFVKSIPDRANIGLYIFDDKGSSERVSIGSNTKENIITNVSNAYARGGTPLATSINTGYQSLLAQAKKQLGYGEYNLVIVTDGMASKNESPSRFVSQIIEQSPIVIHTVGFCIETRHSLNQPGKTIYKSANNPQSLQEGLDAALAESPDYNVNSFK